MIAVSQLEARIASRHLGVQFAEITDHAPPVGAVIGEAPGPNTSPRLPMFPFPPSSAGGRLLDYSRLTAAQYLGRLARRNVFAELGRWSAPAARARADELLEWMVGVGARRAVLLGSRVATAFGVVGPWSTVNVGGLELASIPHPSGRCRVYNDEIARRRAGAAIRWAAGYRSSRP